MSIYASQLVLIHINGNNCYSHKTFLQPTLWKSSVDTKHPSELNLESIGLRLNENLSRLMEQNHISLSVLHRNTGIAIPTIKRLQSDPSTNPTVTTLIPIANFFGVTISQLIDNAPLLSQKNDENKINWLKVPMIGWDLKNEPTAFIYTDINAGNHPYALTVEEDDWLTISKDSILIINPDIQPGHRDFAIVHKIGHGSPTLKQVIIDQDKTYLKPMNPQFSPMLFDHQCVFYGVLMQIRKDMKI
jgi:transcriptional regulator with XRE-family HTH domain